MSLKHICVVAGLTALATSAHGQDGTEVTMNRTPANAQKFLAMTPPESFGGIPGKANLFVREGDVSSPDACSTVLTGSPGRTLLNGNYVPYKVVKGEVRTVPLGHISVWLEGRKITQVPKGTVGYSAGLRVGDEIISVDGQAIASQEDLSVATSKRLESNSAAQITYLRDGKTVTTTAIPVHTDTSNIDIPVVNSGTETLTINWSKIEKISSYSSGAVFSVYMSTPRDTASPSKWLSYSVAETRDRVLAAAQYLQQACDRSKELGF